MGPKHLCYSSLPIKIVFHHSSYSPLLSSPLPPKLSFALPWKQDSQAPLRTQTYCTKRLGFHMNLYQKLNLHQPFNYFCDRQKLEGNFLVEPTDRTRMPCAHLMSSKNKSLQGCGRF
ncbi:hypothetical protein NC652_016474 [Populus alba x Populus x berolinensis]|nr:hypothetical protein NC652_016474 [Populus alba x Populus x berolinensis]